MTRIAGQVVDDAPAINASVAQASLSGGTVYLPALTYTIASPIVVPATGKAVVLFGAPGATIQGSGFTLLKIAHGGTVVRNLQFVDTNPQGGPGTVGIDIVNAGNWSLENVSVRGQNSDGSGSLSQLTTAGIGIRGNFALKGRIDGCLVEGWGTGISLTGMSNADAITDTQIRENTKGIDIPAVNPIDDVFLASNTFEANSIGINCDGAALLNVSGNRFNSTSGERINIRMSKGWLVSNKNYYGGAQAKGDIYITGGTYKNSSTSDVLTSGTTNKGTGSLYIDTPATTFVGGAPAAMTASPELPVNYVTVAVTRVAGQVVDDAPAINSAIARASEIGGTVYFPPQAYTIRSGIVISASGSPITLAGSPGAIVNGTGFSLLTIARSGTVVRDLRLVDSNPSGGAKTIGVDINNGTAGVSNWSLQNVWVLGENSNGDGGLAKLVSRGTGIRCIFAANGEVDGCVVEGWGAGLSLQGGTTGTSVTDSKVRVNTNGVEIGSGGARDILMTRSTIEGNGTGLLCDAAATLNITSNHFENTLGVQTNIQLSAGWLTSVGNFFGGAQSRRDIYITGGNYKNTSTCDLLNSGTTNNGKGVLYVDKPAFYIKTIGTGTGTTTATRLF